MVDATSSPVIVSIVNTLETALTPVFLLAGTAGFLNAFVSRLARLSDRVNQISDLIGTDHELNAARLTQLSYLRYRTLALEIAVVLGTLAGVLTCLAIASLLGGAVGRSGFREHVLYWLFAGAVFALIGALIAFLFEMLTASQSMLRQIAKDQRTRR
ncbi:MAG: DUF2721 domain-containing protein [Phyllobacterium sp.]|uniref:DUF2721 domain-containing protein n=1 Tax=Phyllobacterium sp. TaxID=1871046 RepID=UPI0030F1D0D8